ncbi:unnamed protein product [Sphagnum balticum]
MKNGVKAALIISALAGGLVGASIQEHVMRPKIIENGAGYYEMMSGNFTWGHPPKLAQEALNESATDLRSKPQIDAALSKAIGGR